MQMHSEPIRNQLLASLSPGLLALLLPKLTLVTLESRQRLYAPDSPIEWVYFLEAGMVSIVAALEDGMQVEVGTLGREGMLGASLVTGNETSFFEAMVQMPVTALKMSARDFRDEILVEQPLRDLVLRYNEALYVEAMQTIACTGHHRVEQRLARWLLTARDRADGNELPLTHEFLAMMLGVHRPSVTIAASSLQRSGLIRQSTGRVTILDRSGLEAAACECHAVTRRRTEALMKASEPRLSGGFNAS